MQPFQIGFFHLEYSFEFPHVFSWLDRSFLFIAGIDTLIALTCVLLKGRKRGVAAGVEGSVWCRQSARPEEAPGTQVTSRRRGRGRCRREAAPGEEAAPAGPDPVCMLTASLWLLGER